jgi:hypothetical protein
MGIRKAMWMRRADRWVRDRVDRRSRQEARETLKTVGDRAGGLLTTLRTTTATPQVLARG